MAVNVIMLGPPGAGKGTQGERFAMGHRIPRIPTGDILRDEIHSGSALGKAVKQVMDRGELVSDEVMIDIITERLGRPDVANGFVLDGFPRTVTQAQALDALMIGRDPLIVLDIVVPEAELVRRLGARMICEACGHNADGRETTPGVCHFCGGKLTQRADDNAMVVLERFKVYQNATKPLVDFYRSRPTFRSINGAQSLDRVAADLTSAVEAISNNAGATAKVVSGGGTR
ncbi:MAG TPA: adenylate kinase [Vicinamibacterales bacterium]|nr:adenylate kinase [Vicinamibacterales bacterium]